MPSEPVWGNCAAPSKRAIGRKHRILGPWTGTARSSLSEFTSSGSVSAGLRPLAGGERYFCLSTSLAVRIEAAFGDVSRARRLEQHDRGAPCSIIRVVDERCGEDSFPFGALCPSAGSSSSAVAVARSSRRANNPSGDALVGSLNHASNRRRTRRSFGHGVSRNSLDSPYTPGGRGRAKRSARFEAYQSESASLSNKLNPE